MQEDQVAGQGLQFLQAYDRMRPKQFFGPREKC